MQNNLTYKKALNYSLRLLLRRDHSQAEIKRKLVDKGYKDNHEQVINQLIEWGYLDDLKYAKNYISIQMNSGKGRNKLFIALLAKGISKDIINDALNSDFSNQHENEQLEKIAQKKALALSRRYASKELYAKLFRFLVGRGFNASQVKSWLDANFEAFLDNITNKL